jgi:hypothetical protein
MKKITLLVLALLSINTAFAQLPEDFSGATFPPANWTVYRGANGLGTAEDWKINDAAAPAYALNLWEAVTAGQLAEDWIVTPQIAITSTANVLEFDATDLNQGDFGSVMSIRVSTTSQTDVTSFTEIANFTEAQLGNNASAVFSTFNVDLAAYLNQSIYIAFVHVQNDGDAVVLDNVNVIQGAAAAPGPANSPTPADAATNVFVDLADNNADGAPDNAVSFNWLPDGTLGAVAPDEYEFFLGDSPTTLVSLGNVPATATFPIAIRGFNYNTTYYWQIVPKNTAGPATGNAVWSFTTEVGAISAPNPASTPTPADGATNVTIDTANNDAVAFSWIAPASGDAPESYIVNLGTDPANLNTLGATANTSVDITGMQTGTTYYWQIIPTNVGGDATGFATWSFTTEGTASIDDVTASDIKLYPVPAVDVLNVESDSNIANATIYNRIGQVMLTTTVSNNQIDVTSLKPGMYIIELTTEDGAIESLSFNKK